MKTEISENILNQFGFEFIKVHPAQSGYRNTCFRVDIRTGEKVNLIIYKSEEGILEKIKCANLVGEHLLKNGFNSRSPISKILKLSNKDGHVRYACLYNYLDGETIPWESYVSKHIKLLGGEMGRLHQATKNIELGMMNEEFDNCLDILNNQLNSMEKYFADESVKAAMKKKLGLNLEINFNEFRRVFNQFNNIDVQVLHMDFVRSNILFSSTNSKQLSITGILDFEKVCVGPRILDIARTLAFLIVDCKYKKEEKVRKYFLFNGYQKRGENKLPDLSNLEIMLRYFWFYDFYKFLKHNPYESLSLNEHYLRTVDKLISIKS